MKKNTKVKKTKEEIQAEKDQRWKQMRNLAKSFAKQAGIKVVKEKKTNKKNKALYSISKKGQIQMKCNLIFYALGVIKRIL